MQLVFTKELLFALFAEKILLIYATLYIFAPYVYNESKTYTKMLCGKGGVGL